MEHFQRVGVVGRFRPLHYGSALMLDAACSHADHVVIGVGSANKYNARNPFTADETRLIIDSYLAPRFSNYEIVPIDDYGHVPEFSDGQRWRQEVLQRFGTLDAFMTGNAYVANLLKDDYHIVHPSELIPREQWVRLSGTMVRIAMAKGDLWKKYVPDSVATYMQQSKLDDRFRREFGLQTLMLLADQMDGSRPETTDEEKAHAGER